MVIETDARREVAYSSRLYGKYSIVKLHGPRFARTDPYLEREEEGEERARRRDFGFSQILNFSFTKKEFLVLVCAVR